MVRHNLSFVLFVALLFVCCAGRDCDGTISGKTIAETLFVRENKKCTLMNCVVQGAIMVLKQADLHTVGNNTVSNQIMLNEAGLIKLQGNLQSTVGVTATSTGFVLIGKDAVLGPYIATNTPTEIRGKVGSLDAVGFGVVNILGGEVKVGGIRLTSRIGMLKLCDADIDGGISITSGAGGLMAAAGAECAPSTIYGMVEVKSNAGDVKIVNQKLKASDLLVEELQGAVQFSQGTLSDVSMKKVNGAVSFSSCVLDSDATFEETQGKVTIANCEFDGDVAVLGTKKATAQTPGRVMIQKNMAGVELINNDFLLEDVLVSGNEGRVVVKNNKNIGVTVTENKGTVMVQGNSGTDVFVAKNNQVTISNNEVESINCEGNANLQQSTNSAVETALGQCKMMKPQ